MFKYKLKSLIAEKEIREGRHVTISDIAAEIGVARSTISRIANNTGHGSIEIIIKICKYFGCTPNDLIMLLPDEPENQNQKSKTIA